MATMTIRWPSEELSAPPHQRGQPMCDLCGLQCLDRVARSFWEPGAGVIGR